MGLGLKIRSGQRLEQNVFTRAELMAAHLEMLLDAVSKGCKAAGARGGNTALALNTLIGNYDYIVDTQIPRSVTIWFMQNSEAVGTVELEFDWAAMEMRINSGDSTVSLMDFGGGGGVFAVPDEARGSGGAASGLPLPELRGHANLLEEIITELGRRNPFGMATYLMEYPGPITARSNYSVFVGNVLRLMPRTDFEKRLKMEPRKYTNVGAGQFETLEIKSETNPDLILRFRKKS